MTRVADLNLLVFLRQVVEDAHTYIPFFRKLYGNKPQIHTMQDFASLPVTDRCILGQAQSLLDLVVDPAYIYGTIYAYDQNHRTFPFQVVESEEESACRHERIAFCIQEATGLDITETKDKPERFVILYNQPQAFFSSDLSSELGWECHQNAMVLIDRCHTGRDIYHKIDCFSPDFLFVIASNPCFKSEWIPSYVKGIFTFRNGHSQLLCSKKFPCYDIYTLDEFPYVGVKLPQDDFYRYDSENLYMEKGVHGRLMLTTLNWDNFAWVRYAAYDHVIEVAPGKFRLRFWGHW